MRTLSDLARLMWTTAVDAVRPDPLVRNLTFLPKGVGYQEMSCTPQGRLVLVAIGKASPGFAHAFLTRSQRQPDEVFVLAPNGALTPSEVFHCTRYASHPLPSEEGAQSTRELLSLLSGLDETDGVVLFLSGGSSALLADPLPGVALDEARALTQALLRSGATIRQLNTLRKHLFSATGGRLAARCRASIFTLVLSDVIDDDLATIASGPTVADPTTFAQALMVVDRMDSDLNWPSITAHLKAGLSGKIEETPKPGDSRLSQATTRVLGSSKDALLAAATTAATAGLRPIILTHRLQGEARHVGRSLAALANSLPLGEGIAVLAAGETTVTVRGSGVGGRNLEVALAAACELSGSADCCILAASTDGCDGSSPAAGAVVTGDTLTGAIRHGRDAAGALENNDAWRFFVDLPEMIVSGPTGTNVADLAFILLCGGDLAYLSSRCCVRANVEIFAPIGLHAPLVHELD